KDLFDALNNGVIAGAALDVMETEPPGSGNPLYNLENIIITPHVGWNTKEGNRRVSFFAADRILEAYENKEIKYVVNAACLLRQDKRIEIPKLCPE
ncbi:MAG: hypothetical protein LBC62_09200, partial [Treponema sp.]|nr:hypothetical protein [Treponema sp.]